MNFTEEWTPVWPLRPGLWLALSLVLLAIPVPPWAALQELEERRARAKRLVRTGGWAWSLFHLLALCRAVQALEAWRSAGAKVAPNDWIPALAMGLQASSAGWAVLAGAVVLAGMILRGERKGGWSPWAGIVMLTAAIGACIAYRLADSLEVRDSPHGFLLPRLPEPWERSVAPVLILACFASPFVCAAAALRSFRAERAADPEPREAARLSLGGTGLVLLSLAWIFALSRLHFVADNILILGPKLTAKDLRLIPGTLVFPGVFVFLGVLASAFGLLHLKRPRGGGATE